MRMPICACPFCGHPIDGAMYTGHGGAVPAAGDYTVCLYCANVSVFTATLTLRRMTEREAEVALGDKDLDRAVRAATHLKERER